MRFRKRPPVSRIYPAKKYTVKQFKRFSPEIQEKLSERYHVILTDYKVPRSNKEKIKGIGKSIRGASLTTSLDKIDRGMKKADKGFRNFDMGLREIDRTFTSAKNKKKYDLGSFANF